MNTVLEAMEEPAHLPLQRIFARGDVILNVGTPVEARFLVSSAMLSLASPIFDAMLNTSFIESLVQRSEQNPQELKLPDDDVVGISDMCLLLHHNGNGFGRESLTTERIYNYAVIVDKYQLREALVLQSETLMHR